MSYYDLEADEVKAWKEFDKAICGFVRQKSFRLLIHLGFYLRNQRYSEEVYKKLCERSKEKYLGEYPSFVNYLYLAS